VAFSYDPAKLADSPRDQVRFRLGDTFADDVMLQDEEIDFLLGENRQNVNRTIIAACRVILANVANLVDFRVGPYSERNGNRLKALQLLLDQLLAIGAVNAPIMEPPTTDPIFEYEMFAN
jgi:hypothetical protein